MPKITNPVEALAEELGANAQIEAPSSTAKTVGDVVVHLTEVKTAALRRLLTDPQWTAAVLTFDSGPARAWSGGAEAAHYRAEWLPWYEFDLVQTSGREPEVWRIRRLETPLLEWENHQGYQHMVGRIFTGKGKGIGRIAALSVGPVIARKWVQEAGVQPRSSAAALTVEQWVQLYRRSHDETGRPASGHSVGSGRKVSRASGPKGAPMRKVRW